MIMPTHRYILDAPTTAARESFQYEPFTTDFDYKLPIPLTMDVVVKDAGLFKFRDGSANRILSTTDFDECGRPLTETIVNDDTGIDTVRNWYYDPDHNYEAVLETGETEVTTRLTRLTDDVYAYTAYGGVGTLIRTGFGNGSFTWLLKDDNERVLEEARYGTDGKLKKLTSPESGKATTYTYDPHGRLIEQVTSPGSVTLSGVNKPNVIELAYDDSSVVLLGQSGGTEILNETRHYDDFGRPTHTRSVQGPYDLGSVAITTELTYPAPEDISFSL